MVANFSLLQADAVTELRFGAAVLPSWIIAPSMLMPIIDGRLKKHRAHRSGVMARRSV